MGQDTKQRSRRITITLAGSSLARLERQAQRLGTSGSSLAAFFLSVSIDKHDDLLQRLRAAHEAL